MPKYCLPLPPQDELLKNLAYDPATGVLTRKVTTTRKAGTEAGCETKTTRQTIRVVGVCGRFFVAHRLIWKMMTGQEPPEFIDHIDGNSLNNRWNNLRLATNGQNRFNSKRAKNNSSGFKGVHHRGPRYISRPWRAVISANGKHYNLGQFATPEEAAAAVNAKRETLHGVYARIA